MLIAFTIVVLGGMGSVTGALLGGLFVGVVESISGLYLGDPWVRSASSSCSSWSCCSGRAVCSENTREGPRTYPHHRGRADHCSIDDVVERRTQFSGHGAADRPRRARLELTGRLRGQYSFGHAAFFGTGCYVTAILQVRYGVNAWLGFVIGVAAGALVGAIIGVLSFRSGLRGSYFALVTLAFAEVLRIIASVAPITGAGVGTLIKLDLRPEAFQFQSLARRSTGSS